MTSIKTDDPVVGTPVTPKPELEVETGDAGHIEGKAAPGSVIEAINLSSAPEKRLHTTDAFILATTGADGSFHGAIPDMQGGDILRLRLRSPDGKVGEWHDVVAKGADTRNAQVALFRIGLTALPEDKLGVSNINASRQVSEPGAKLTFVNERTDERTTVTLDKEGTFPEGLTIPGQAGDTFSIRVSDGAHNLDFASVAGKLTAPGGKNGKTDATDIPDPALDKDSLTADGTPRFETKRFKGPLFEKKATVGDVKQGNLGDCYLPAAVAALVHARPGLMERLIKDNKDGTYTVTFKDYDWEKGTFKPVRVKVDGDLYVRSWGGPLFGSSANSTEIDKMELWWPILEKAYATWQGSYDAIGHGGQPGAVFEAILGVKSTYQSATDEPDTVWAFIKKAIDRKKPIAAVTYGESEDALYTNTGVYSDHTYSIIGYAVRDGVKLVKLRNPWGESEPYPGDGVNDGIFELPLEQYMKLYQSASSIP